MPDSSEGNARLRQAPPTALPRSGRVPTLAPPAPPLAPRYRAPIVSAFALQLPGLPDVETLRIHAAVPDGHQRPRTIATWQRHLDQHQVLQELREDARRNASAVLWAISRYTDRATLTARPTWAVLMTCTGLSRSTIANWLAWARRHRLIGHVEQGSTEQYRSGQDPVDIGNRAAVYVLLIPRPVAPAQPTRSTHTETRTPSRHPTGPRTFPRTRARAENMRAALRAAGNWDDTQTTRTQAERLKTTRYLQFASPVARLLSDRHLRHLCRDFLLAGWCAREILYALDHLPSGAQHPYAYNASDLRVPAGWLAHRLMFWRTTDGTPLPGYRQAKHQAAAAPSRRSATPGPAASRPVEPAPAAATAVAPLASLVRDRQLRAQVRTDRLARQAAERDHQLRTEPPQSTPATPDRSAVIRARALARARQERVARAQAIPERRE